MTNDLKFNFMTNVKPDDDRANMILSNACSYFMNKFIAKYKKSSYDSKKHLRLPGKQKISMKTYIESVKVFLVNVLMRYDETVEDFNLSIHLQHNRYIELGFNSNFRNVINILVDMNLLKLVRRGYYDKIYPSNSRCSIFKFDVKMFDEYFNLEQLHGLCKNSNLVLIKPKRSKFFINGKNQKVTGYDHIKLKDYAGAEYLESQKKTLEKIEGYVAKIENSINTIKLDFDYDRWLDDSLENDSLNDNSFDDTLLYTDVKPVLLSHGQLELTRHFHKDLKHYGRYYQNGYSVKYMNSKTRKYLLFNDEPIQSLDIVATIPSITCLLSGHQLPEGDFYTIKGYERDRVKQAFVIAFNATGNKGGFAYRNAMKNSYSGVDLCKEYYEIVQCLVEKYPYFADYFGNPEKGKEATYAESRIITRVYQRCIKENIPVIDIFDCMLTQKSKAKRVKEFMYEASEKILGARLKIKEEL